MVHRRLLPCLALGIALQATTPPARLGVAAHLDVPGGDLRTDLNDKPGVGASFQAGFELGRAATLRPRLDLDYYRVSSYRRPDSNYREEVGFTAVGVGADLLFAPGGDREHGPYGLAGAGAQQWFQNFSASDYSSSSSSSQADRKANRLSPWAALGLGCQLTPKLGLEVREVFSSYDGPQTQGLLAPFSDVPTRTRHAAVTQLAVTFRFR